jgi:FtsP/CotA-like multicopper oxidase with cupredoxin domain
MAHPAASPTTAAPLPAAPKPQGTPLGDGTYLAPFAVRDGVKVFTLRMSAVNWEVSPGVFKEAYTFNGLVPGPVIRVNEGDRVRVVVKNALPIATGVHWHGMILPNKQDGVPGLTQPSIAPGQTYTYEWTAIATGTHWYHAHSSGRDIGRGLYGVLEVVPKQGEIQADRDYRLVIGDTDLGFVFNGKSYPATVPLGARVGERVRIRLIGAGDLSHPIHLHGSPFEVVAQDGLPLPQPTRMDTLLVSAGQTFDIVAVPVTEGRWLLHCHIFAHSHMATEHDAHASGVTGIAAGMNGITTTLDVGPAAKAAATTTSPVPATTGAAPAAAPTKSAEAVRVSSSKASDLGWAGLVAVLLMVGLGLLVTRARRSVK